MIRFSKLALASALSLGLLVVGSVVNDRGGFVRLGNILDVGREYLPLRSPAKAAQGSGCMPTTGTVSGLTFAQDVNAAIAALISSNSGASAPATDCSAAAIKGQVWLDTSTTPNVLKQYDGTSWVVLGALDSSNHLWSPPVGGGTASVTAASTTDICAAPSAVQTINGTTPITSFGSSCVIGARKTLIFASATPLTYNATSFILPGQRSYTATVGDMADAIYLGSGNWRVKDISKIDGSSVTNPAVPLATVLYGDFATIPAKTLIGTGQAIARASYPDYLAAVTRTQTGTLTAGNNTITSITSGGTRGFGAGMPIEGTGIQAGTTITSVTSTTIVMSQTATANGAQSVTVFTTGYGSGGDSTTVGVKSCVGRVMAGLDPSATNLSSAAAINSVQGSKSVTLTTLNLPPYTPSGGITNGAITNTAPGANLVMVNANGGLLPSGSGPFAFSTKDMTNSYSQASSSFAGSPQGGTSTPFATVQPTVTGECVVVVLP